MGLKIVVGNQDGFFNCKAKLEDFQEPAVSDPTFLDGNDGDAG
jgi:hypothetical protein